jgi:hypothetical protein
MKIYVNYEEIILHGGKGATYGKIGYSSATGF